MAASPNTSRVTTLLTRWSAGDAAARDELIPLVYERLRGLAHHRLRHAPGERSLNTTGLVHEAYLKLVAGPPVAMPDRAHLLALASRVMRNLLVDRARARAATKRGRGYVHVEFVDDVVQSEEGTQSVLSLDAALRKLAAVSPRQAEMLEQRYFGGLSLEATAHAVGVSLATVKRELRSARAWLALELDGRSLG